MVKGPTQQLKLQKCSGCPPPLFSPRQRDFQLFYKCAIIFTTSFFAVSVVVRKGLNSINRQNKKLACEKAAKITGNHSNSASVPLPLYYAA